MSTTTASAKNGTPSKDLTISDLSDQISILKKDIATLTGTLSEYGKLKTAEAASTARATVADITETGKIKALDAQAQAEEFVRQQPATALGIAAGLGFLVGLLSSRR